MSRTKIEPCATCLRFPVEALQKDGNGICAGFEAPRRHDQDNAACPLYVEAKKAKAGRLRLHEELLEKACKSQNI